MKGSLKFSAFSQAAVAVAVTVTAVVVVLLGDCVNGEDPYRFFTWNVTYGDIYPLGVRQQVRLFKMCYEFLFIF